MNLAELKPGQSGIVVKVHGHGAFRKRVIEMGFVKGHVVTMLLSAPLRDPVKYNILGYEVSLRRAEAELIEIVAIGDDQAIVAGHQALCDEFEREPDKARTEAHKQAHHEGHIINVALIGNPNCGKTSLFNIASGAKERVGNYSGVTVDATRKTFHHDGYQFNIVDLPGTYSLTCYSPEELYVRSYLRMHTPDVIINVVDSSNLERNLYLTTELIDMDISMVVALNMYDELRAHGDRLDYDMLGRMIGVPIVPIVSKTGEGVASLFDTVISVFEGNDDRVRHVHVNLGTDIEMAVRQLVDSLKATPAVKKHFSPRYVAIKLLEGDHEFEEEISRSVAEPDVHTEARTGPHHWREHIPHGSDNPIILMRDKLRARIENLADEDISSLVAANKYGFIAGALAETLETGPQKEDKPTRLIDRIVTHKIMGYPLFLAIMFFIFWATFWLGQYPMDWIEAAVEWIRTAVDRMMTPGPVKDMVLDGVIGGVGSVIVFLPNILILYFCISLMEDTGYMARAAFIMDKVLHRIGLHGKSFIPLMMGFGCNVPAILSTRIIESRSSRLITILINPFMSCSARIPIYVLIIGTFFPGHAAVVFFCVYLLGILMAVLTARLLRRFYFHKDETPFVMELPPYRMPPLKSSLIHTWDKGLQYLKKMGGIILFAGIIVWALNYFPIHDQSSGPVVDMQTDDSVIDPSRDSYLEMMGKAVNPLMTPLGFPWRATVAAIAGVPAKEIVVSTLGVLYTGDESAPPATLGARLERVRPGHERPDFTPAVALSFMVFILLYCPCVATVAAVRRETNSWGYAAFTVLYNTALAWVVAFAVYRSALWLGL